MIFFRELGGRLPSNKGTRRVQYDKGIPERAAWIQAGWYNDFKYATPVKLNDIVDPSEEKMKDGVTIRVGLDNNKWIYKKEVKP